jgi:hypothetical protein
MLRSALFIAILAGAGLGCVDPEGRFNRFLNGLPDGPAIVDGPTGTLADISGTFLFSLSAPVAPDKPLLFISTNTMQMLGDGTGSLSMSLQGLTASDRTLVPGTVAQAQNTPVAADGTFHTDFGQLTIPAATDTIILGAEIMAMVQIAGNIRSTDLYCGIATGMVQSPIPLDLAGTTWGAIRVPPGTVGNALPRPVFVCPSAGDGGVDGGVDAPQTVDAAAD